MNKNIILIGSPDSHKAIIGKTLSKRLGLKFIDMDQHVINKDSKFSPVEISTAESIEKLVKGKSLVISAETDFIKNNLSIKELRENGVIIFIDKSVENIVEDEKLTNDSRLSKDEGGKLREHFSEEYKFCRKCCDLHLTNNNNVDEIVYYISSICS
ncbi:hypothetical protein JMF89_03400 [Clostridiaceae bacterium UIB06]|uniref:Shikimate kinase n=1 Tax=Clostridium thailandense TaxID=2794346 RepID=A0A949WQL8_9CLOT|nr:shikimate kinase [Clostridium thailandense]MBV7272931.1 hypothetical protein [Clostridium thailandense]MCH5136258.1 hypothetical protein [Clostridiaceae bacterium UIB06]